MDRGDNMSGCNQLIVNATGNATELWPHGFGAVMDQTNDGSSVVGGLAEDPGAAIDAMCELGGIDFGSATYSGQKFKEEWIALNEGLRWENNFPSDQTLYQAFPALTAAADHPDAEGSYLKQLMIEANQKWPIDLSSRPSNIEHDWKRFLPNV